MKNQAGWFKAGMVLLLIALGGFVWVGWPSSSGVGLAQEVKLKAGALEVEEELYPINEYGWLTYYMHEVYERYNQARTSFDNGDMALAEANLIVMEIFGEVSKDYLPDKLQDGHAFDKEGYKKSIDRLNAFSEEIRGNLKKKKWADVPEGKLDPMMQTCVGCHSAYNIPTDFHIDSKFKVLTHVMHEIYELYKQAGPFLQEQEWDKAKYCFIVLRPYIESIPDNIPEVNQDGEAVDKELFMKAYRELKQFTEDLVKRLEDKTWMTGKPLPPPRIVVDNCYACHAKAAKIPSPW